MTDRATPAMKAASLTADSASEDVPPQRAWRSVAVIGMGTMGRGIARAAAEHGLDVVLFDRDSDVLESGATKLQERLQHARRKQEPAPDGRGSLPENDGPLVLCAVSVTEAVAAVDVVVECVPELPEVKSAVLAEVFSASPSSALVATNTSTMSITKLDDGAHADGRLVGLHFFNPAHKMPLVEVILQRHQLDGEPREDCDSFVRCLGKVPIFVQDVPGFVTSRLGLLLGNEAMHILEAGYATAEDIDRAMRLGYNHPMGPLELADLVGLDARLNNLRSLHESSGDERFRPPEILVKHVAEGRFGRKSGHGFYSYDGVAAGGGESAG